MNGRLALGRERHFTDALEARTEHFVFQAGFACSDHERAFGRICKHSHSGRCRARTTAMLGH
jgi:hypothetical protein